jgi:hypothetical protein
MSDDERDHEQLRRRLADEGQAQAPVDLAGEVMRQVRSEPRRRRRRSLRPALVPLAAALLAAAAIAGLSRLDLGGAGSGSGGGSFAEAQGASSALPSEHSSAGSAETRDHRINGVAAGTALNVLGPLPGRCVAHPDLFAAAVPGPVYDSVQQQLERSAVNAAPGSPRVDVLLRHAPKAQTHIRVTCP